MYRFLYLPIFEPGDHHQTAVEQKRGLFNALSLHGPVQEWDYLANDADTRYQGMVNRIEQFEPTHIFTQFHGTNIITPDQLQTLRSEYPNIVWINWSGDSWNHGLIAPDMLALAKQYDVWLVAAPAVLAVYYENYINAYYWNIAYEPPVQPLPEMPAYDVVFLANVINDKRKRLMEWLKELPYSVGIYGDWERSDGRNTYDFAAGEALYKNAKIAIADNVYPDQQMYISNRPMQAIMSNGPILLHQYVPGMIDLSGWVAGRHYIEWRNFDDLRTSIDFWMTHDRSKIVRAAYDYTRKHHTFEARVNDLINVYLPTIKG